MRNTNLANRYAQAIFEVGKSTGKLDLIYKELKVIKESFLDSEISNFYENPVVSIQAKIQTISESIKTIKISEETKSFLLILAEKGRLSVLSDIVTGLQEFTDQDNGVTRGEVVSSHLLSPEERQQIEDIVSKKTNKRVILVYKEDSKLIGGLIARVDGYTFDDTLSMHLNRLNEDLKRRVH